MTLSTKIQNRILIKGMACMVGGLLFTFSLTILFSLQQLPSSIKAVFEQNHFILKTTFFLSQVGFMAGLAGLFATSALGNKQKLAVLWLFVPFIGQVFYAVSAWLPAQQVMTLLPLPLTQLGAMFNAVGMLIVGIMVIRAKVWQGRKRWIPLFIGLYPFLVMFPILIISGRPPGFVIGMWGLLWTLLGVSIYLIAHTRTLMRV